LRRQVRDGLFVALLRSVEVSVRAARAVRVEDELLQVRRRRSVSADVHDGTARKKISRPPNQVVSDDERDRIVFDVRDFGSDRVTVSDVEVVSDGDSSLVVSSSSSEVSEADDGVFLEREEIHSELEVESSTV